MHEFDFEFLRERDLTVSAQGGQAVVWTNPQHHPSLMPDKLYDSLAERFGWEERE